MALYVNRMQEGICCYNFYKNNIEIPGTDVDHVFGRGKKADNPKEHWLNLMAIHYDIHFDKHHQRMAYNQRDQIEFLLKRNVKIFNNASSPYTKAHINWRLIDKEARDFSKEMFDESFEYLISEARYFNILISEDVRKLSLIAKDIIYA